MKTTLSWLKTHLDTDAEIAEIAGKLVMLGHDIEGVEDRAASLAGFVVARVVKADPHPNADRLRVCVVDAGSGEVQVVCGAPNARTGMKGVFGPAGVRIPKTGAFLTESSGLHAISDGELVAANSTMEEVRSSVRTACRIPLRHMRAVRNRTTIGMG